jgi:hypothetical protein
MARIVSLVHPDATSHVPAHLLVSKCDLFADDRVLAALPCDLKSRDSLSDFREVVSALESTTLTLTKHNIN